MATQIQGAFPTSDDANYQLNSNLPDHQSSDQPPVDTINHVGLVSDSSQPNSTIFINISATPNTGPGNIQFLSPVNLVPSTISGPKYDNLGADFEKRRAAHQACQILAYPLLAWVPLDICHKTMAVPGRSPIDCVAF
jgi:hypothetical protein